MKTEAVRAEGNHVAPVIVTGRDKAKLIFSLVNVCVRVCFLPGCVFLCS